MKSILSSSMLTMFMFLACSPQKSSENSCERFNAIDKNMLETYDRIESVYGQDEQFLSKLNMSQVYWIQYRDRHLAALYPKKRKEYKKGDWKQFTECECKEMIRLTEARIETLNMWLSGPNPYEDCPTSIN
jgi:uncharacterized protein YecT (DUF1311 family)